MHSNILSYYILTKHFGTALLAIIQLASQETQGQ